jgi:hypothetical protein
MGNDGNLWENDGTFMGNDGTSIYWHCIIFHIYIWVNDYNDFTATSAWNHDKKGKSSPNGRKSQVSEIL